jgi:signal transduction histidine kinase
VHEVTGRILEQLAAVVPYERSSVMLAYGSIMRIVGQRGFPEDERAMELQVTIRKGDVFEQVVAADGPVLIEDVTQVSGWRQVEWLPLNLSWMGLPLIAQDRVIGMISLTRKDASAFSSEDATLASAFAGQAAVALENARLYDELNDAYQLLERLDKTKSDFIDVAAHELRTPLTVIRGYAQVMEMEPNLKNMANMSELVKGILAGADRLHAIVNSMLDVTKLDSQTLRVHRVPTSLAPLVARIHAQFASALQERNLNLTTDLDGLPEVTGDPELLAKVFYHLIVNAIKYTPDGGSITVSGKVIDPCEECDPVEGHVEIVVSDTGIGIDPANHELIFEKFYQTGEVAVHSSGLTKFRGGGPGLGLAIARGIVLAHGGKIWVESEGYDDQRCPGSRFRVRLPLGHS